ncbi:hypothetical protein CMK22_19785 [Candidatus Poribacteria bacterium]|nr:hypothetical protein [Candidatus Poribacteria bacterium]
MDGTVGSISRRKLTDESVFAELSNQGFCVLPSYLPSEQVKTLTAAARRLHPSWADLPSEELPSTGDLPSPNAFPSKSAGFPYEEPCLNQIIVAPDTIALAKRWLETEQICMRGSGCSVRYPGFVDGTGRHVDGFSLLPTNRASRRHNQLKFWYYLSDVESEMAPTSFWPTQWDEDGPHVVGDEQKITGPAGSLVVFSIFTYHSRNDFIQTNGERYVFTVRWGRRDHPWEGMSEYVMSGSNPAFSAFVGNLAPSTRELFHFPPVGHPYYTEETLSDLENRYPGWDAHGEYHAAIGTNGRTQL